MHYIAAAALLAGAVLLQGCADRHDHDGWGMEGGGRGGGHGGGGKPGPFAFDQKLDPVEIKGVTPIADPKRRFSMAICTQSPCNLTVYVDAQCNITLDPQYMGLRYASPSMDFELVFTLKSYNNHRFAQGSPPIETKDAGGNNPVLSVKSNDQVSITFKNAQQARRFIYGIAIEDASGKPCGKLDPGVIPDL